MKSRVFTIHEAKTHLSQLLQRASKGEEVIIARGAKPVAKLVALGEVTGKRQPGSWKGRLVVNAEFFEPLPTDELDAWE